MGVHATYKISGEEREKLKGKLHKMKYYLKVFKFHADVDDMYVAPEHAEIQQHLATIEADISKMEKLLKQKL
jgi:hypothetical protein